MREGDLYLRLKARPSGATVSPYAAFGLLLGADPEDLRSEPVSKEDFTVRDPVPALEETAA
jgi:hypothetical protein